MATQTITTTTCDACQKDITRVFGTSVEFSIPKNHDAGFARKRASFDLCPECLEKLTKFLGYLGLRDPRQWANDD